MNKKALFLALFTVVIWASSFAGIRASLLGGYTTGHLVLVRFLTASGMFLLYSLLPGVHFHLPRKEDLLRIILLGWLGITVYHTGLTFGVESITAGTASMIVGSAPVFTAIIAVFILKERLALFSWIGLGIGFIGIILITLGTAGANFSISEGAFFVLIATIATSIFFVFQKPLHGRYKPIELTAYFTWAGTLPMLIFSPGLFETLQTATMEAHLSALFVGIFPAALGYAAWGIAISLGNPSSVTSMLYIEPVIAIVIAWLWLGEWPNSLSLIGGTVAISSVFLVNFAGRKQREREENVLEEQTS
ncbi:DMT family transporter [Oceanobacillus senegalensis]|uniref:DMT family transporter n=1 Tax=Oceanobacillus senegalensis TaxID=1936063 RepID=UPI000A3067D8|nr:DMT family transporter [Oceanobacillus senegalensis]